MRDNTDEVVASSLGVSAISGVVSTTLFHPDTTIELTVNGTTGGGLSSSINSSEGSMESLAGEDSAKSGLVTTSLAGLLASGVYVIKMETKNNVEYDLIEKRANKIYDKYHKSHIPSNQKGKGIIIAYTPETAVICNEMFNNTFVDEYHLVLNIESLLLAVSGILDSKELVQKEKEQLESTKDLLIELKAAYTEKKIITLSTKDNETLSFILNSFKKHQENKKNNAKKLIKKKEKA